MSYESCLRFLRDTRSSPRLGRELKAATAIEEVVRIGRRHGYAFTIEELMKGSSSLSVAAPVADRAEASPAAQAGRADGLRHHEYDLTELPGFEPVIEELPRLKVMPPTVDLDRFAADFREEDLRSTSMSPADPAYRSWHEEMMKAGRRDSSPAGPLRRDFHLINLDEYVDCPGYDAYFAAKTRVVAALEGLFGDEVRFSGAMWYPPAGYRLWHTNEDQPGWRMYVVDVDRPFAHPAETSFFRYLNPHTHQIVTLPERPRMVRFFKVEQAPDKVLWHCIVNPTVRHRWSFGLVVPENWMDCLGLSS